MHSYFHIGQPEKLPPHSKKFLEADSRWESGHHNCPQRGIQRGNPFGSGFPIGASSIPVGTRFSVGKSSVLYLCGADGSRNCSTPRKVWLQLRRSGGKGCPLRGGMSDRKRMAGGANMHCQPSLSSAEQRYIKAPVSRCLLSYQNHHGSFPRRLSIASPSTFFVRLSLRWKWSAAPISGCSIPSVKP